LDNQPYRLLAAEFVVIFLGVLVVFQVEEFLLISSCWRLWFK